jgi:uncharacterized protein
MPRFRILALDGGGLLGAFSASVLVRLEELCEKRSIVEHFDLITGTSTGGIIAIGLAMGVPATDILKFYRNDGPKIFPKYGRSRAWVRSLRTIFRPKFRAGPLRKAIGQVVGERTLSEAQTRLVVPAYEASPGRVYVFKTPHADPRHSATIAADVALATSAAPTYFPAHAMPNDQGTYIDGGVWANCPVVVGITEAVKFCERSLADIDMLSIGTTSYPFRIGDAALKGGYFGWAPQVIETFMFGQVQGAVATAECLLRDRFLRIDADTPKGLYTMDDAGAVDKLIHEGRAEADKVKNWQAVAQRFLNGKKVTGFKAQ